MISADFSAACAGEISPGNETLLCCTAAAFTSAGIPDDFVVLCQLIAPCRPSMQFLTISSQLSHSLPSHGRSPFHSWLQIVVSSFPCSSISTRDLNPIYNVPMLGTHKPAHPTAGKVLLRIRAFLSAVDGLYRSLEITICQSSTVNTADRISMPQRVCPGHKQIALHAEAP